MSNVNKRLDDLESRSGGKGGHLAIYQDPEQPGTYWEKYPFGSIESRGKRYSQSNVDVLENERELLVINFVTNWRPDGEQSKPEEI